MKRKIRWVPIGIMVLAAGVVDLSRHSLPDWLVTGFTVVWLLIVVIGLYRMITIKR
ncbi:hypothetical protein ACFQ44_01055 [Levilactobacillus lanxiensis]|uniref:Uncharacterized protein n=1 Tax=Levilactobacillus lanxiensis TaxID=2799568 RepID=A0ABW4CY99_9LACO|nr:hypothetical protein [Levilactobacillus lanxiensis]